MEQEILLCPKCKNNMEIGRIPAYGSPNTVWVVDSEGKGYTDKLKKGGTVKKLMLTGA